MDRNQKIVIAVVVVVAVVLLGWWLAAQKGGAPGSVSDSPAAVQTPQGTAAAPGASAVTEEGKVVTAAGEVADNSAAPGSAAAPQQSAPIEASQAPSQSVKIAMGNSTIEPKSFNVTAGRATTLVITSSDTQTHVFKFRDPSLQAVAVGIGPGESRLITFNAPTKAGDYEIYCDVPGHAARGETAIMTVK